MAKHHVLIAAAFAVLPFPAIAGVTVIGSSSARLCYLAADSPMMPRSQDLRRCDAALEEAAIMPRDVTATYVNRGILRMMRSDYSRASLDFGAAIAMDPNRSEPYLNMAILQFKQGKSAEALPLFSKAIELGTEVPEIAYYGRGLAHEDIGNVKAAYDDLQRAVSLKPKWDAPAKDLARYQVRRR